MLQLVGIDWPVMLLQSSSMIAPCCMVRLVCIIFIPCTAARKIRAAVNLSENMMLGAWLIRNSCVKTV